MPQSFSTMLLAIPILILLSTMALYRDLEVISLARAMDIDHGVGTRWKEYSEIGPNNGIFGNASTLEEVWSDLKLLVPNRGSNGYIQPKSYIVEDFERIVLDMLMVGTECGQDEELSSPSSCDNIDLRSLKGKYRIGTFVDGNNGRSYCIFATSSAQYPWGNVIVDLDKMSTKNLSFDCPHPKFDAETGEQGIRMLKGTRARSWIVAGSHRMANNLTEGNCQPKHFSSDAAHSIQNCFLAAVAAVKYYYETVIYQDYTAVQLHGMGSSTCGSIGTFFSHGSCSIRNQVEKIDILQSIAASLDTGKHAVAGRESSCNLCGSTNIQGRLINGVARENLCDTFASSYNGRFIQIEQKRDYRRESFSQFWNNVFNEAYPRFVAMASEGGGEIVDELHDTDQECDAS